MPAVQHLRARARKIRTADARYCRSSDWWKDPRYNFSSTEAPSPPQGAQRRRAAPLYRAARYKIRKNWTFVILSPGAPRAFASRELQAEFHALVDQWQTETSFHSSLGEIFTNQAYQRIMAMGRDALPLILAELRRKPGHWFYALEKIAGRDMAEGAKTFAEARTAWLRWGRDNNYMRRL